MVRQDARIVVAVDSAILEATDAALELLGLSLEALRALPRGSLALDEGHAAGDEFRAAWEASGRGEIVGTGTLRLADGRLVRIRYLVTPRSGGTYEIIIEKVEEPADRPPRMYTIGTVLSAWRAAERRLERVVPGSGEWDSAQAEIEYFRAEYRKLAHRPRDAAD
jgi:PAS domain-containing protein